MSQVSVIIPCYNHAQYLGEAVKSVIEQTHANWECIIVDDGSTDDTEKVAKQLCETDDGIRYIYKNNGGLSSARNAGIAAAIGEFILPLDADDRIHSKYINRRGIYHAMNKGINKARGEYLIFLNSSDRFYNTESLSLLVKNASDVDLVYGDLLLEFEDYSILKKYPDTLNFAFFLNNTLPHPASLVGKDLFKLTDLFSEGYKIVSDWEFFILAVCKFNCTYKHIHSTIAIFNHGGLSSQKENLSLIKNEMNNSLDHHFPRFVGDYKRFDDFADK